MYPCRGVLHTPHNHPARDDCISHESPNDCPFSLGMIEGRMQYVSTWKHPYHPSIQYVYPCRGLLNTPHKHPERDECTYQKSPNDSTTPEWPIEGPMQYAPMWAHLYYPSIKCAYCGRGVLHTPYNHLERDDCISHESPNDCPFLLGMIEGRMQYAPTRSHMYPKPPIVSDDGAHLYLKFSVVSDNNK